MDIRNAKTERTIKDALLDIMKHKELTDISVSEVARAANISRSTFYAHFSNLEQVFSALVDDQVDSVRSIKAQLHCDSCTEEDATQPFCARIRKAGRYEPVVRDKSYLPRFLEAENSYREGDEFEQLIMDGIPSAAVQALKVFQLNGCYNAALSVHSDREWAEIRPIIDEFIRGGINAVRTMGSSAKAKLQ